MTVDSKSWQAISQRAVGQFPISVATSLAIESFIGVLPEAPTDSPEINKRDLIKISVRTMFRNLFGSLVTEQKGDVEVYSLAETLANEMRTIESLIAEHSDGRCQTEFYYCSYMDLLNKFQKALVKVPNTPGQKYYANLEAGTCKALMKEVTGGSMVAQYVRDFSDSNASAVIVSHYPIDLLQRYRFQSLSLLESHTGAVKPPMMWNTKLQNGRELEILPFDRMTLQMFGDGVMFSPMPLKIRQRVYKIAVDKGWTPATTKEYVIRSIEENRDPALEVLVKDLYRK